MLIGNRKICIKTEKTNIIIENPICKIFLMAIMILPDEIFSLGTIYESVTPGYISYRWLNYRFGAILFLIIIIASIQNLIYKKYLILGIIVIQALREIFLFFEGKNSIFDAHAYEIYLTLFIGLSTISIFFRGINSSKEGFFWKICIVNVFTIYLNLIIGKNGIEGRYNAINLDVGFTGTLCGMVFLHILNTPEIRYKIIGLVFVGGALLLSGSRVNLLLVIGFVLLELLIRNRYKINKKKLTIVIMLFLIIIIGLCIFYSVSESFAEKVNDITMNSRMLQTFDRETFSSDKSIQGRIRSIAIGIDILKSNPLGISGYFLNLQLETIVRGFPTFPHSAALDAYILLGPIVLFLFFVWGYILVKLWKRDRERFWIFSYMVTFAFISGGPILNFKIIFFYGGLTVLYMAYLKTYNAKRKQASQQTSLEK